MYAFLYWIYSLCCCHKQKWFPDFHVKWLTAPVNECSHCMYRQLIAVMFLWEENSLLYSLDSVSCQSYSVYCSSDLWVKTCLFPSNLGNFDLLSYLIVMSTSVLCWIQLTKVCIHFLFLNSGEIERCELQGSP